jgi:serine/threonine-protein kinase
VYSAGVVLYEMLTGRLPYEGDSPVAVAIQHINSIPLSPREIDPSIPEAMEEITMKAMASNVDKRYVSADAMLTDLEEFRKNPNINFDYNHDDLLVGVDDEPTQVIGANSPQVARSRTSHGERLEETGKGRRSHSAQPVEEEEDIDEGDRKRTVITIVAVILCLVGVCVFLWTNVFRGMTETGTTYEVPNLLGYTLEEAQELPEVTENGFTIVVGKYVTSDEVPADQIVSQTPNAQDKVKAGAQEITVDISLGKDGLTMPDVYNKDQRVAQQTLEGMGLVVEVKEENSDDITKGNVISQSPAPEESVEEGDTVTIVVSLGRRLQETNMITVTNMSLEDATRAIQALGLRLGTVESVASDEYSVGMVCYQSISAYTIVQENTVVNLKVSTGPATVQPPDASQTVTEPSESPAASQPVTHRKTGTVDLPNDRDTVTLQVTVDGVAQYSTPEVVETKMRIARFTMTGSGVQEVVVYLDGVEAKRFTEDFDA